MSRRWISIGFGAAALALVLATLASAGQPQPADARSVEVRVIESDGFRWGDAAVGALVGVGLTALCVGAFVATDRRWRSAPRRRTPTATKRERVQ